MIFDKDYYDRVFPEKGIHRHEHANDYADYLIAKHGLVKFLDIGCGCGILVKTLREKGAEAWGIDISQYAIANSCSPEFVKLGDIRNIPFDDNSFDVVHSSGVMGYFPKEDVDAIITECKRVGKIQDHNIDYNYFEEHGYDFIETQKWWEEKING